MIDGIEAINDADLAALDKVFDIGESGGKMSAMIVKRKQYWGLRERLRLALKALDTWKAVALERQSIKADYARTCAALERLINAAAPIEIWTGGVLANPLSDGERHEFALALSAARSLVLPAGTISDST